MPERRRKHWGWGFEDEQPSHADVVAAAAAIRAHLGMGSEEIQSPVPLEAVMLREPRLQAPEHLREICKGDKYSRASHAWGRSYTDVVRGFHGEFDNPPDVVAYPRDENEVEALLEWCSTAGAAAIPYGGGTSVVGGVEPRVADSYNGAVSIDLAAFDRLLDVDAVSRSARIQAGATGPRLEAQLAEHDLTLRHFPQSFEFSTLGGWIATRAGGHFATLWTHIEDFVESARAISPAGVWESRRLPGSGAGPSPDRMLAGSEGILGVITEAWVRVQPKPTHRSSTAVLFDRFYAGADAVRAVSQSGLHPSNCRLIDGVEAETTGIGDGTHAVLVLGFESTDHDVSASMDRALELCAQFGGTRSSLRTGGATDAAGDAVSTWRNAFLRAPYMRDTFVAMGVLSDTFETAITWERFPALHEAIVSTVTEAMHRACGAGGRVSCRFTHVYPDGPAPYYTVLAPAKRGAEVEQWAQIKAAASDVVIEHGATITHHHAVGRDHRPWYDRQRPGPFATALRAAKATLDPSGVLNPGVLIDPRRPT